MTDVVTNACRQGCGVEVFVRNFKWCRLPGEGQLVFSLVLLSRLLTSELGIPLY